MAEITAGMVKELRDRTGAGMMESKKALVAAGGDIEAAIKALRESGAVKAEKKSGRDTKEGRVAGAIGPKGAAVVSVLCETDFVAKNDQFLKFIGEVANAVANASSVDPIGDVKVGSGSLNDALKAQVATIGENLQIGKVGKLTGEGCFFGLYVHHNGKIGVVTKVKGTPTEAGLKMAKDIAMHAACSNPVAFDRTGVPAEMIAAEREIYTKQAEQDGKPANMIPKIVDGKINAFYKERCLVEQMYVLDAKKSIKDMVKEAGSFELVDFAYVGV